MYFTAAYEAGVSETSPDARLEGLRKLGWKITFTKNILSTEAPKVLALGFTTVICLAKGKDIINLFI